MLYNITSLPLSLFGLGGFKSSENNTNEIIWNTYFRYYSGPKPKIINYPIILTINIRRLEEKIIMKISNCSLFSDLNDYLQYNCKSQLDEGITLSNIKKISILPEYTFDGKYVGYLESIDLENAEPIILFDQEEEQYSNSSTTRPSIIEQSNPLSLYGFGGFKYVEKNNEINWNTYFRYYSGQKLKIISYPIILTINISRLEEKTITKNSNCSLLSDLNDFLQYECKSQLDEGITLSNIKKISIQPEYTFDGEYVGYLESIDQENAEPIILFDQEEVQSTIFLSFDSGTINIVKNEDKFYINNLILLFSTNNNKNNLRDLNDDITGNYKFLFYNENINKNKSENVSCILSRNKDGETYDLECKPSTPFTAHINNSTGYGDDESNKNNIVNLNVENDYVELDKDANLYYSYSKKSSNGLSKGALAGIIIACVVALIAIIVVFIIVRKNYKSQIAIPQESQNDIMQKNLS